MERCTILLAHILIHNLRCIVVANYLTGLSEWRSGKIDVLN
jgi:hypothetical protein